MSFCLVDTLAVNNQLEKCILQVGLVSAPFFHRFLEGFNDGTIHIIDFFGPPFLVTRKLNHYISL